MISKTTRRFYTWMVAATLLVLPAPSLMADAGSDNIPITDPALLERLGFEPDATDVYATPQAYEELLMDPAERAALQRARSGPEPAAHEESALGGPYGTSAVGFTPVLAQEIRPRESATEHELFDARERSCLSGPPVFDAQFDALPHGARLLGINVWYYDDHSELDLEVEVWRSCQPDAGSGSPDLTLLGSFESSGTGEHGHGAFPINADNDIDLQSCAYYARIDLGGEASCSGGSDLTIQRVRARWRRQVSPAPQTATFDDVPPSHLFFQQIEALAASGITGGCDANNFCPNEALTRAQMAAFLAKALGLHWGSF